MPSCCVLFWSEHRSLVQTQRRGPFRAGLQSLGGSRPRNPDIRARSKSGSHCILLENIDIYFSSQLELNTILPGLKNKKKKKRKTKQKHSESVHNLTPTCPYPLRSVGCPTTPVPLPSPTGWGQRVDRKILQAGQVPGKQLDRSGEGGKVKSRD